MYSKADSDCLTVYKHNICGTMSDDIHFIAKKEAEPTMSTQHVYITIISFEILVTKSM